MIRRKTAYRRFLCRTVVISAMAMGLGACEEGAMISEGTQESGDSNSGDTMEPSLPDTGENGDKPSEKCTDECAQEGAMRCDAQGEYVCGYFDADPCFEWSEPSPCEDECQGDRCKCVSECSVLDEIACDGTIGYMFCQDDDGDGCLQWTTTFCSPGHVCDPERGGCKPFDELTCSNVCIEGSRDCVDEGWRECRDVDGDGCTEWTEATKCEFGQVCSGGKCSASTPECTDACQPGSKDCVDNGWRECRDVNGDGCTEWAQAVDCGQGKKCDGGECIAACTDACEKDKTRCSGSHIQTCVDSNGDGCTEWSNDKPCEFGCDSGACKPNPNSWVPPCSGANCPIIVTDFTKFIEGNTQNGTNVISNYAGKCSNTNESGPEQRYIFKVDEPGTVILGTTEPKNGDVDVHLLKGLNASDCLARGDKGLSYHVDKGIYYAVVDTFSSSSNAGAYRLKITFLPDSGKCGLETGVMERLNTPSQLQMPTTGAVVQEAHLVTDHDQAIHGAGWWPSTKTQGIAEHIAYSEKWTGVNYGNAWCPSGEGGCQFGQGSTGKAVPWKAEAYYVCMYWKTRPKPGTRFLVVNPVTGKAVVTAAGYETGPRDGSKIGGAVYEVHQKLGTSHNSVLTFGQMRSQGQSLEYGPIDCE